MTLPRAGRVAVLAVGVALLHAAVGAVALPAGSASATVPGTNGRILYYSAGNGLFTVDPDGRNRLRVAQAGTAGSWSPDGARIAWVKGDAQIWTMVADGSGKALLLDPHARVRSVAWAPDGTTVALAGDLDDPHPFDCSPCNYDLYTVGLDGTGLTRLTATAAIDEGPEWSPDGSRLVFGRTSADLRRFAIVAMRADGTGARILNASLFGFYPSWSPDGTRIAFSGTAPHLARPVHPEMGSGSVARGRVCPSNRRKPTL